MPTDATNPDHDIPATNTVSPSQLIRVADQIEATHTAPSVAPDTALTPPTGGGGGPWPELPGYDVVGEIARGGMGAVLRVRDRALGRDLAVKVLLDRSGAHPETERRFRFEAAVTARLQHPGIV